MKYIKTFCVVFVACLLVVGIVRAINITPEELLELGLFKKQQNTEELQMVGSYFTTEAVYLGNNSATTTKTFFTDGGASSTLSFDCDEVSQVGLNLLTKASSTSAVYQWDYEFSNDNIDWFGEDGKSVDSKTAISHGSANVLHTLSIDNATTTKNITISSVASQYCRINFNVTGANGALWAAGILKKAY